MSVSSIHANFAWVVIFANAIAGVWSLGAHQWAALRVRALWWFIIAAEVTIEIPGVRGHAVPLTFPLAGLGAKIGKLADRCDDWDLEVKE